MSDIEGREHKQIIKIVEFSWPPNSFSTLPTSDDIFCYPEKSNPLSDPSYLCCFPEFSGTPLHVEYPVIPLNSHLKTNLSSQQSVEVEVVVSVPTFESHGFSRWVCLSFFTPPSRDTLPKQYLYTYSTEGEVISTHCK